MVVNTGVASGVGVNLAVGVLGGIGVPIGATVWVWVSAGLNVGLNVRVGSGVAEGCGSPSHAVAATTMRTNSPPMMERVQTRSPRSLSTLVMPLYICCFL